MCRFKRVSIKNLKGVDKRFYLLTIYENLLRVWDVDEDKRNLVIYEFIKTLEKLF